MSKQDIRYFLAANTSKGYRSFFEQTETYTSNFFKTFLLPQDIIRDVIERIRTDATQQNFSVEIILNPLTNEETGILIPKLDSGFVNLGAFENFEYDKTLSYSKNGINDITKHLDLAYGYFGEALKIHDKWEEIYISNMSFDVLDNLREDMIQKLLPKGFTAEQGVRKDRFLGAATYKGPVDYIQEITQGIRKRYFVKGRPGTGKSTFMKGIAQQALDKGFNVDVYHCAFDPDSIDMIIIKNLSVSIFDSTAPHEHFPSKSSDEIIDIYDIAVKDLTDERYEEQLSLIESEYKEKIAKAIQELKSAKNIFDDDGKILLAMDEKEKKQMKNKIYNTLLEKNKNTIL